MDSTLIPAKIGQRIVVTGLAGAGKTRFAQRLAGATGLPIISVDGHSWDPGWVRRSEDHVRREVEPLLARDRWIVEGNDILDLLLQRADTVIFLDTRWWVCAARAFRRGIRRPDHIEMPEGCVDSAAQRLADEWGIVWRLVRSGRKRRARLLDPIQARADTLPVHMLHSRQATDAFLRTLNNH